MSDNELTEKVIGLAIKVHKELGPGLLESAYEACLYYELVKAGFKVERQMPVSLKYFDVYVDCGYRADLFIEDRLIVELKAVTELIPIYKAQILTHMKILKCKLGLLMNFNVELLKNGIKRFVL
jgi:GxxExxY protein